MPGSHHILVVDDDHEIRRLLSRYLTEQGLRVTAAGDARAFHKQLDDGRFDLVVLDVLLPDGSGLDLCRLLRQRHPALPVILVTALREEVDRIIGLEIGADDYIGKPFNPRELLARIRAVLRRASAGQSTTGTRARRFRFSSFAMDVAARTVTADDGTALELTGAEFDLLRAFLERPGRILSRDQLLELTQGREAGPFDRSIDVLMSRIRRKLGALSGDTLFKTVRNGGYQLTVAVAEEHGD